MPGVVSPSITQTANGVNLYQPVGGGADVINNLVVTNNATVGGTLAVTGATTLSTVSATSASVSGAVTAGSLSSAGAVSATSASVSGAVTAGSLSSSGGVSGASATISGAVSAGSLSSSGGVSGASATISGAVGAGSVVSTGNITSTAGVVTSGSFVNSTATASVIQIVNNGVPTSGVTVGSSGAGNNLLTINMSAVIPSCQNFKSYKIYLSGSASSRFVGWNNATSGGTGTGAFLAQFQSVSGYDVVNNYKGNCAITGTSVGAGGGGATNYPDNVTLSPGDLSSNTVYYAGTCSNGATAATNANGTIIWLHFVPLL
jgi:hypothetical protein